MKALPAVKLHVHNVFYNRLGEKTSTCMRIVLANYNNLCSRLILSYLRAQISDSYHFTLPNKGGCLATKILQNFSKI